MVEDDDEVRAVAAKVLRRQGYDVLEATRGAEAIELCRARTEPIDLILTDVVMPKMSGPELAEALQGLRQDFRVLYMSGHPAEILAHRGMLEAGTPLVQKPFDVAQLAVHVRHALDERED